MSLTAEQITAVQAEISNYPGAGAEIIEQAINQDGSALVSELVTIDMETGGRINISNLVLLAQMTPAQRAGFRAALAADEDLRMLYEADKEKTVNDPIFLSMLDQLKVALALSDEVVAKIVRPGQRLKSRAEELIGRKITVAEVQEALNG